MPTLRIQLLGPPAIYYDDQPLNIQRRVLRSLLFYLAYDENMIDRARLILLLWPEKDEKTGRRRMRETLSKLRAELPDADLLVTDQDRVGLDRSRLCVDALEFNEHFSQCSRVANAIPRHIPLPEQTQWLMKRAIELWRTPLFMSGVNLANSQELDYWLTETGRQLERRREILIERMAHHCAASGDFEAAITWMNAIKGEDPSNVDRQVSYLAWLQQLGRRGEALAYSSYLKQMYHESGERLPELLLGLSDVLHKQDVLSQKGDDSSWFPPAQLQTVFVGRQKELQQLNAALQRGGVTVIIGESGSGKTRLFYEFSRKHAHAARVMVATAYPGQAALPYQPLLEMFRRFVPQEEWQRISPTWIAPLVPLMPELARYLQQTPRLEDTYLEDVQSVIFECLHQVLKETAGTQKLLLFLDNVYSCDRTTLDLLVYMLTCGFFDKHGLLVLAVRPEEVSDSFESQYQPVRQIIRSYQEIRLDELSLEEASELVSNVLGRQYAQDVIERLLQNTSGQPLHLIETLRSFLEQSPGIDLPDGVDQLPLPQSIRDLVLRRVKTLSPPARKLLQIAAVAGSSFSPALLEKSSGLDTEQVVRALEELERQRLVQSTSFTKTGPVYHFLYGRIRRAVQADLSEARKRMIHLAVANAMKSLPLESSNISLIASHFETAGELKPAFDHWVAAGIQSVKMYSRVETKECFRRAASLLPDLDAFVTDEEIYQLYLAWGDFLDDLADFQSGLKIYFDLQVLGSRRQSDILLGAAYNGLSRAYRRQDDYEKSLHFNKLAQTQLEASRFMPEYSLVFHRQALTLNLMDRFEEADAALQKSIELAAFSQDRRIQIGLSGVFLQLASVSQFKGLPQRILALSDLAQESFFTSINDPDIELIRITRAQALSSMGFPQQAYALCHEVLQVAQEWSHKRLEAHVKMVKAFASMALGYMDECLEDIEDVLAIAAQFNYHHLTQQTYCILGDFYRLFGEYQRALDAHRKGIEHPTRVYYRLDNEIRLAYNLIQLGEQSEGMARLDTAIGEAQKGGFSYISLSGKLIQASGLIRAGVFEQAERVIQEVIRESELRGVDVIKANTRLYAGYCAFKKGAIETARQHIGATIQFTRQNGNIWVETAAQEMMLQVLQSQGENTDSVRQRMLEVREHVLQSARRPDVHALANRFFDIRLAKLQT